MDLSEDTNDSSLYNTETTNENLTHANASCNYFEDRYSMLSLLSQATGTDLDDQTSFKWTFRTVMIFANGTIASLLFGYDTAIVAGLLLAIKPEDLNCTELSDWNKELITGITCIGCFIGASFYIADKYGRKFVLQLAMLGFVVSSIVMTLARTLLVLVVGRFLIGISIGFASTIVPLYLSEISPTSIRSSIMTLHTVSITGGQVLAYIISLIFRKYYSETSTERSVAGWRYLLVLPVIPALLMLIGLPFVPESPRHLIYNGKLKEAQKALSLIYPSATKEQINRKIIKTVKDIIKIGSSNDSNGNHQDFESVPLLSQANASSPTSSAGLLNSSMNQFGSFLRRPSEGNLNQFFQDIMANIKRTHKRHATSKRHQKLWFYNFEKMDPRTKRALWVGCTLMFFQQICGFNAFMNYSPLIFRPYTSNPLVPGFLVSLTNFLGTLVSLKFINKFGSRKLLIYTIPGMIIGLFLCVVAFAEAASSNAFNPDHITQMMLISMLIFVFAYASAMGNVPHMSVAFLPLNKKSFGTSCILMVNWSTNFLVTSTYLSLVSLLGDTTILSFYLSMTVLAWFFVWKFFPEIKGLSLEEIGEIFTDGIDVDYVYKQYHS
ncbi:hypothetical protein ACO0QE_004595 [Hanseniaspora vineae]